MPGKTKEQQAKYIQVIRYTTGEVRLSPENGHDELQTELRELAKEIACGLSSLEPTQSKELLGAFVSELYFSVAEEERRAVRRRKQAEGIAAARAREVQFGAPRKPLPDNFDECHRRWREGELKMREAAEACGMPKTSFYEAVMRKEHAAGCAV